MPHLFTNRQRQHNIFKKLPAGSANLSWEQANAWLYIFGGLGFTLGSLCFLPVLEPQYGDTGAWLFFASSLIYLIVVVHDLIETTQYYLNRKNPDPYKKLEGFSVWIYTLGSLLFSVGSLMFYSEIDRISMGSWCFITGSLLFVIGACFNVMQISYTKSRKAMQLLNAVAITFIVGSIGFTMASIPYLWKVSATDQELIYRFTASVFTMSSLCFVAGGIFNFKRVKLVAAKDSS